MDLQDVVKSPQRGIGYFAPQVGDELELFGKDYSPSGFRAGMWNVREEI